MYKNKTMQIKKNVPMLGGETIVIADTWLKVYGKSWMFSDGNPAAMQYAMRAGLTGLPADDNVWYGKIGGLGYLVHELELEEVPTTDRLFL